MAAKFFFSNFLNNILPNDRMLLRNDAFDPLLSQLCYLSFFFFPDLKSFTNQFRSLF